MSELANIRERIQRATAFFKTREAVVLTTFNLDGQFLENQALPITLNVDPEIQAVREASLHEQLAETECAVYYDPSVSYGVSGKFRYVARPVPLRNRLFHAKLVIIAGKAEKGHTGEETTWVYLAVSSANLSLSGWGRNAESFGETWIHTPKQQAFHGLTGFLNWLQDHAPIDDEQNTHDAVRLILLALGRMRDVKRFRNDETQPWSGSLYARFYSSPVNTDGFPNFLKMGRSRRPSELWVYSPYWGNVSELVKEFDANRTLLVPSMTVDRSSLSLSKKQSETLSDETEIWRNEDEKRDDRFWHMKAYRVAYGKRFFTAVGSCNFTEKGLSGASGNIEAMLVFDDRELDWPEDRFIEDVNDFSDAITEEEEAPKPIPVVIVVAYDWLSPCWRWYLDAGESQNDFRLSIPGSTSFPIKSGSGKSSISPPEQPGGTFEVTYTQNSKRKSWKGQIIELHLDHSNRTYGKSLSASDILESYRTKLRKGGSKRRRGGSGGGDDDDNDEIQTDDQAAFDTVNLYDLFRSMRGLRARISELKSNPQALRGLLAGRSDSVLTLARLADDDDKAPVVRYLVLRELSSIIRDSEIDVFDTDPLKDVHSMLRRAKKKTLEQLESEFDGDREKSRRILAWFEKRLQRMDPAGI